MARKVIKKNSRSKPDITIKRTFTFSDPEAERVQLLGDFTRWQEEPIRLRKGAKGLWRAEVKLPPGEHHYRFMVDGQWRDDPACEARVPNAFGSHDCVCRIG